MQQNKFNNLESGDLIIVADSYTDGVALTPVLTDFDKKLKKEAPETEGIQFIRYPSVFSKNKNYIEIFKKIPCSNSLRSRLSTCYGLDAVYEGVKESSYYTDDYEHPSLEMNQIGKLIIESTDIDLVTGSLGAAVKFKKLHVLSNKKFISLKNISNLPKISTVYTGQSTAKGIYTIDDIESKLTESTLWFDYLPELKMEAVVNGKKELLNLVKNKKIKPQLNVSVSIPITWNFTLPANKKFYHFPLVQGNGGKNFSYEAFIESDVFPLKESLDCSLELTYTYGAENPYKLAFIPKRNIGEHRLNVQWKFKSDIPVDLDSLPIPPFPKKKTENYYKNYPNKKDPNKKDDIVEWFSRNIDTLQGLKIYSGCNITNEYTKDLRDGKKIFIYEITDKKGRKIEYCFFDLKNRAAIEEDIKKSKIIFEEKLPEHKRPKYYTVADLRKKIRFPMYALFNDGLKITDFNQEFCNKCKMFIEYISKQIEHNHISASYINECVYIACSMTDELPDNIVSYIRSEDFSKGCNFSPSVISRAFHECRFSWQREFLKSLIGKLKEKKENNSVLFIVSKAIWKNEKFVLSLSKDDIKSLAICSLSSLKKGTELLKKSKNKAHYLRQIATCLELLLGLLRSRALDDIDVKSLLAPNSDLNKEFLELITSFEKLCISEHYSLKSFLEIQIDSKSVAPEVPILVSACKIFLLCEDDSDSIRITGLELDSD